MTGQPRDRLQRVMQGGWRAGGSTNYITAGSAGGLTQAGTNTNTLAGTTTLSGATTISGAATLSGGATLSSTNTISGTTTISGTATFTAAPAMSGNGRPTKHIWRDPSEFYITGASVTDGTLNSRWHSLYFHPDASSSDVTIYADQIEIPEHFDSSAGITPTVWWSRGAAGASGIADWVVSFQSVDDGEVSGTASEASIAAGASLSASTANQIEQSALSTVGTNVIVAGDLLSMVLRLEGSDGLTTAGCLYFLGLKLAYRATSL